MKGVKHYTEDGEYKGETHKMNGEVHTGAKHSKTSKVVSHKPGGPFKMKGSAFYGMSNQSPMYKKNKAGKEQGADGKACWEGYSYAGTENGKDKCVPNK
tara:strand:- start:236 stop:532 length:297 start_codon:yes stop_codon:yes gene_type:complete